MSTRDLARFGYLHLRRGIWKDQQLLSEKWIDAALIPCDVYPDYEYGYMWWVNTEGKNWPRAPRTSFAARGAGSGIVWVDPENDLVFVLRWFDWSKGDEILYDLVAAVSR
jgi:CubicO group peptidase (beta-lactamase class C family)